MGEFFEAHTGPHLFACRALASELRVRRCRLRDDPPGRGPHCFVELAEPAYGSPIHARLAQATDLCFFADARRRPSSWPSVRFEVHCPARAVGEFFELHPGPPSAARADLTHDVRRGLGHAPGYSPPRVRLLTIVTTREDCSLNQDAPRSALPRGEYLPAPARLRFRMCAYHLESRRPCASTVDPTRAARYGAYRSAVTFGEYRSLNCAEPRRAAMDIARDVRCWHCTNGGIYTAGGLRAVHLSTHAPPGLKLASDTFPRTSSHSIAIAAPASAEGPARCGGVALVGGLVASGDPKAADAREEVGSRAEDSRAETTT